MDTSPQSKLEKIFKFLGIALGVVIFLGVVLIAAIFYYLPSAQQLSGYFKKDKTNQSTLTHKSSSGVPLVSSAVSSDATSVITSQDSSVATVQQNPSSKIKEFEKLKEFIDDKTPALDYCSKLSQAKSGPISTPQQKTQNQKNTIATDDLDDDLRLEAIKPFFKTILKQPETQKLLYMVMREEAFLNHSPESKSDGMFEKAQFYKQAYSAFSEMKENLPQYESVVDRSYLMYKLNDLLVFKPELQNDPRIMKFCEDNEDESNSYAPVDFQNEKQVFERLIQELGVDAKSIKYDPEYKTTLKLNFSKDNLQISGGWLEEILPQPK